METKYIIEEKADLIEGLEYKLKGRCQEVQQQVKKMGNRRKDEKFRGSVQCLLIRVWKGTNAIG